MRRILVALLMLASAMTWQAAGAQEASVPDDTTPATPAAEEAPAFPPQLSEPDIAIEELRLRLIPLQVSQIEALAREWMTIVQRQTEAVIDQQVMLLDAEGAAETATRERLTELTRLRDQAFRRYSVVLDGYARKGGDQAVVDEFRAYRNAIVVDETQNADFQTLMAQAIDWAMQEDGGIRLGIRIAVVVSALLGLLIVARIIRGFARRGFGRIKTLSKLLQAFLAMVVYWITIAFGLMIVLSMLGIDITPVFALVGGLSFIIAFAFQDTLGNLAAGLMIMANRPFDEGDYVTIAGNGGTVKAVSVVATTITTPDNQVIVIPNSKVWGDVITNVTASTTRRVDLVFGVGYEDDLSKAQSILEQIVSAHPLVLSDPAPVIRVNALGASSVEIICRPWTRSQDYWTVYWDLIRQVKDAFDAEGIHIPFPQTEMHLHVRDSRAAAAFGGPALAAPSDE